MAITISPISGGGYAYGPLTELDAVNEMLRSIGEQPLASGTVLDNVTLNEAILARDKLHRINRDVQAMGLECNTEEQDISYVTDEYYELPANTLRADPKYASDRYVLRYDPDDAYTPKLYDPQENTFNIAGRAYGDITCNVVLFRNWLELPHHVREYMTALAMQEFQEDILGSESVGAGIEKRVVKATVEFYHKEAEQSDDSMFDNVTIGNITRIAWSNPARGGSRR